MTLHYIRAPSRCPDIDPEYMPFERFGNIVGSTSGTWAVVGATGISCVARSSELRAVRVNNRTEGTHLRSSPPPSPARTPIMTVLGIKECSRVLRPEPLSQSVNTSEWGKLITYVHTPFTRLPSYARDLNVLYGVYTFYCWLFVSNWRLVCDPTVFFAVVVYSGLRRFWLG
jgi:hypothetical protein